VEDQVLNCGAHEIQPEQYKLKPVSGMPGSVVRFSGIFCFFCF